MGIKKIRVTNFKSFKELEIELGNFNVLIGANASGKTNFVQIFGFLRDIMNHGLDNAISMQGGMEYLGNINIGASEDFSMEVTFEGDLGMGQETIEGLIGIEAKEAIYEFALRFKKRGTGYKIVKENLMQKCEFVKLEKQSNKIKKAEKLGKGEIVISRINDRVRVKIKKPRELPLQEEDIYPAFLKDKTLPSDMLLLRILPFFIPPVAMVFNDIAIYDFDPKLPKKATPIAGKADLEEDGSNLSIVLKNIIGNKEGRRKLFNLVKELLPFIEDLDVEKFADKSLLFKLREEYTKNQYIPASLISDGTINITALIVALYFERKWITIIEEPERNIHPYLISRVVDMMKDASRKKQIIVTTHNPEIVRYAGLGNILLVSRDKEGFSVVSRPADKEEVKVFLENEIGIDELFVQNLLEN